MRLAVLASPVKSGARENDEVPFFGEISAFFLQEPLWCLFPLGRKRALSLLSLPLRENEGRSLPDLPEEKLRMRRASPFLRPPARSRLLPRGPSRFHSPLQVSRKSGPGPRFRGPIGFFRGARRNRGPGPPGPGPFGKARLQPVRTPGEGIRPEKRAAISKPLETPDRDLASILPPKEGALGEPFRCLRNLRVAAGKADPFVGRHFHERGHRALGERDAFGRRSP